MSCRAVVHHLRNSSSVPLELCVCFDINVLNQLDFIDVADFQVCVLSDEGPHCWLTQEEGRCRQIRCRQQCSVGLEVKGVLSNGAGAERLLQLLCTLEFRACVSHCLSKESASFVESSVNPKERKGERERYP
ncbi:putative Atp-Dependent Rna Helicase Ddx60 [Manis pentadactyla]|nr:putative Atp-Dependent Rna Helicase Ddx60 [Manis pentadactyla]